MTTNHPAQGPVSLERLHQIREILSKASAQSDGGNLGYAMADAVKVIDGAIAELEEQDNPRPVMAVKGELGFIDNLEKIIEERDEDIDIGQLGRSNYDALMLAALDAFRASIPEPVVPEPKSYMDFWEQYPDMAAQEAIERSAGWTACRAAMLQSLGNSEQLIKQPSNNQDSDSNDSGDEIKQPSSNCIPGVQAFIDAMIQDEDVSLTNEGEMLRFRRNSPVTPDGWIPVSERMPEGSEEVLCTKEFDGPGDWRKKVGYWHEGKWVVYGASWTPTHWMPLPAAPQQEVNP